MTIPADLIEALAVSPMYHLFPQQELAPLLSFSRFEPCELDPSRFLPTASSQLAEAAVKQLNEDLETSKKCVSMISSALQNFESTELDHLKFKKPVIMGHTDRPPDSPQLEPLYEALFRLAERVKDLDLVDLELLVEGSILGSDKITVLENWKDQEEVRKHKQYYEGIIESLNQSLLRKRLRLPTSKTAPRRKIQVDMLTLNTHKEATLYSLLDQLLELPSQGQNSTDASQVGQILDLIVALARSNKLANVVKEYLLQAQATCVKYIKAKQTSAAAGQEAESPKAHLHALESVLAIMNAGVDDRRLHVQSSLQSVIECIGAHVENAQSEQLSNNGETSVLSRCIDSLSVYLSNTKVDELVLTQLEYICVGAIFSEATQEAFGSTRNSLLNLLVGIFKSYESQRLFIVNEMLLNLKRLPPQKSMVRQLRLKSGTNILIFTAFILRIIQSFDTLAVAKESKQFLTLSKSKNPHSATNLKRTTLLKSIASIHDESSSISDKIAEKFLEDITSADLTFKFIFNAFLEDSVAMLPLVEWSGSVTIIESFMRVFLGLLNSNSLTGNSEPYVLEIVGKIGHEIFQQKCELSKPSDSAPEDRTMSLQKLVLDELTSLLKDSRDDLEFQYVLLKYLKQCETFQSRAAEREGEVHIFASKEKDSLSTLSESTIALNRHIDELLSNVDSSALKTKNQRKEKLSSLKKAHLEIVLNDNLSALHEQYLSVLMASLESSKAKVATKAIKLLSRLIEIDTRLLLLLNVNLAMSKLLTSNSSLSRDAVIDLLGTYVSENSELILKYCKAICERAGDSSVLVRRRVMKLMKVMYTECPDLEARAYIARSYLKQLRDSDKVVSELSKLSLFELWFKSAISPCDTVNVMAQVLGMHALGSKDLLRQFLRFSETSLSRNDLRQKLKILADLIIELVVEDIESSKLQEANRKLVLLSTLLSFDNKLMNYDEFRLLEPYMFESYEQKSDLSLNILRILKLLLKDNKTISGANATNLRNELLKRLTRLELLEVHQAVPIIQLLSELLGDNTSIVNALLSSMRMLKGMLIASSILREKDVYKCTKLLHLLGCIGAYCDMESSRATIEQENVGLVANETVVSLILKYLLQFSKRVTQESIQVASIRNIVTICSFRPKIFLSTSVLSVLDETFQSGSEHMKLATVEGLNEFFAKEEKAMSSSTDEVNSTRTVKLDIDNFHGTVPQGIQEGISASLIQRFFSPILAMCLKDVSSTSLIPVQFLRLVTNLGFANPKVSISTVIALEASPNKLIKKIATEIHTELFDKYESLTDRSYTEAFKLAFRYTRDSRKGNYLAEISFLRSVYKIVNRSYLSKKKFVLSLAKLFVLQTSSVAMPEAVAHRDSIVFLCINILVVSFTSLEEVCLLIYHLDRVITMDGMDIADQIKTTIESKSGEGMSMENLQLMFLHAQSVLALIYLRQLLAASYGIGLTVMETFRPSKPDMELRQAPKSVLMIDYPTPELELATNLAEPSGFGKVFTRMILSMKAYTT